MAREDFLHIIIAETSPILSAGFSQCLRHLPRLQTNILEVKNPADLFSCIEASDPDIILINPTFGGIFNPATLRPRLQDGTKIVAIEVGKLSRQASALFDEAISVVDDMETVSRKINSLLRHGNDGAPDEKEPLTQREKEIISLVVKGMTNQEIADRLFLSIHTVITHRRNIARKLEIHSATGLTIYAIVNKIVDLSEIKL